MFVSGPWPVRVGRAGQEADGGEVGGGGGGVGLRVEAARRSGAASEETGSALGRLGRGDAGLPVGLARQRDERKVIRVVSW